MELSTTIKSKTDLHFRNWAISIISVTIGAVSLAFFLLEKEFFDVFLLGFGKIFCFWFFMFLLYLFWITYSLIASKLSKISFLRALYRDAFTYLPFLFLNSIVIKNYFFIGSYYSFHLDFILTAFAISLSLGLTSFLKTFFWEGSNRDTATLIQKADVLVPLVVAVLTVLFFVFLYAALVIEYEAFSENSHYYHNILWLISHGKFTYTLSDLDIPNNPFGTHLNLILFFLVPFYYLFQNVKFLFFVQSSAVALGIIPIYRYTTETFKNPLLALSLVIAYIFNPVIWAGHLWGFTVDMLAVSFLLFAFYYFFKKSYKLSFIFLFLVLMCKEPFALIVVGFGLFSFFVKKRRKFGIGLIFLGIIWGFVAIKITTYIYHGIYWHGTYFYLLKSFLSDYKNFLSFFIDAKHVAVFIVLLISTGFLSLLGASFLFVTSLPFLFVLFLNPHLSSTVLYKYYFTPLIPIIFFATILGVKQLFKRVSSKEKFFRVQLGTAFFLIVVSIANFIFLNPFIYLTRYNPQRFSITPHKQRIKRLFQIIPQDASVCVSRPLRGHFARRDVIYGFPLEKPIPREWVKAFKVPDYQFPEVRDCDYVVVDVNYLDRVRDGIQNKTLKKLLKGKMYGVVAYADGLVVFKRKEKRTFKDFVKIDSLKLKGEVFPCDIEIVSYKVSFIKHQTESEIAVTLIWQVLNDIKDDYVFSFELFNEENNKRFQFVHVPFYGLLPPNEQKRGDVFKEIIYFPLPKDIPLTKAPYKLKVRVLMQIEESYFRGSSITNLFKMH